MLNTTGFMGKMMIFILLITAPVAIVAFWMVTQGLLQFEYFILLTLTPVGPAVLIYNRLLKEINALSQRMGRETSAPLAHQGGPVMSRAGLLPVNDLLLAMQQYRRVLQHMLKEAKSQQEDASLLFNMLPDPVLVLDAKRRISRSNEAARSFFNAQVMEGDVTTYLRHPSLIRALDTALEGNTEGKAVEFAIPGNVFRHIAAYVVNLQEEGGEDLKIILTLHDLTVSKKIEQMRVDFVANASHELRTPLAILIGAIETLQGPASGDPKAQHRFLDMMHAQSQRMSQLIDDLLSLSQIEMHEHSRPISRVNLADVLQGVTDMIKSKAADLGKSISLELPGYPVSITGDKDQLFQVFTNLVDNAIKYGRENTPVVISLAQTGQEVVASVTDQGEGIPTEHLPRLTERFYRVDSDRSREMGGTGLGLAIVKHIVSRHRGHLEIVSEMGKGSTFSILLPSATSKKC